jgi:hypothetical protein
MNIRRYTLYYYNITITHNDGDEGTQYPLRELMVVIRCSARIT